MRVVHAGCGVNALSGLQKILPIQYIAGPCWPDKRSASGSFAFVISLEYGRYENYAYLPPLCRTYAAFC
ncbi:hypothetical protein CWI54_00150 [Escherichia coli]|nr:hypothetical protein CWI54_00150 [Escherichia coli]